MKKQDWCTSAFFPGLQGGAQNLPLSYDAFQAVVCKKMLQGTLSDTRENWLGLEAVLEYLWPGDTLVVWKLDGLGHSLPHLIETVRALEARGIGFKSLRENTDTTTSGGTLVFHRRVFGRIRLAALPGRQWI